ncbi:MAG: hypothetical protein EPN85_07725 [Bacteroidetes bacterium]|nr:MAG: hypothetical protein EPN85_07725 [Bacteroidota bacterium]
MGKKKAIWLFAGGPMQEVAAKRITELGYSLIITDMNKECICAKYAALVLPYDTFDVESNLNSIDKIQKAFDLKAVMTTAADCHYSVNVIAKKLGLPGLDPEISKICRNKHLFREVMIKSGVYQPKSSSFSDYEASLKYVSQNKLSSFVVKATDNSGSRGFNCIEKAADYTQEIFNDAKKNGTTGLVIIEEMLIPIKHGVAELSVETLWCNGKMYFLNWVDRLFRNDLALFNLEKFTDFDLPWGVELGHINPSQHDHKMKVKIIDEIYSSGCALGFDKLKHAAILKADIMITDRGPVILELTPRLSGGWDSSLSSRLRGSDFVGGLIRIALGETLTLEMWYDHFSFQDSALNVVVLSAFNFKPKDCTGRSFTVGTDYNLQNAFAKSMKNLTNNIYV